MMQALQGVLVSFSLLLATSQLVNAYSDEAGGGKVPRGYSLEKTVFVIEVTVAGAADPKSKARESSKIGAQRIKEYLHEKQLLSYKYNPNSILSLAPVLSNRSSDAKLMVQAMYPLTDMDLKREINYLSFFSPLKKTAFEQIMTSVVQAAPSGEESRQKVCLKGPVQRVTPYADLLLGTQSCQYLESYMHKLMFAKGDAIFHQLDLAFDSVEVEKTKQEMKALLGPSSTILQFYSGLLFFVGEQYKNNVGSSQQMDQEWLRMLESQASLIHANKFLAADHEDSDIAEEAERVYLTRALVPILQTLVNAGENMRNEKRDHLKYVFLHAPDNLLMASLLKMLNYWDTYGYTKKPLRSTISSLRFELQIRVDHDLTERFYVKFIYDDEPLKLPWCDGGRGSLCDFNTFVQHAVGQIILDFNQVEEFCQRTESPSQATKKKAENDEPQVNTEL